MTVTDTPLAENSGAEVTGLDLRDDADAEPAKRLNAAFVDGVALVLRDRTLTPQEFVKAASIFDTPMKPLLAHATEHRFIYRHKWRRGDTVVWDNRSPMHQARTDCDMSQLPLLRRTMLEGTKPV